MPKSILASFWTAAFLLISHNGMAAQFITIADATINIDKIEFIQPNFCNEIGGFGTCSFTIVFGGAEYSTTITKDGYGASHSAKDKLDVNVTYDSSGDGSNSHIPPGSAKNKGEALKLLKSLRDLLPK